LVILTKIYAGRAGSSDTKNRRKPKLRTAGFNVLVNTYAQIMLNWQANLASYNIISIGIF
jgi:hypothetical protein